MTIDCCVTLGQERETDLSADDLLRQMDTAGVDQAVIQPEDLRRELIMRLRYASKKDREFSSRRHGIPPA